MSNRPSKALIAYSVLSQSFHSNAGHLDALIPFIAPIANEFAGKTFDPSDLVERLKERYYLNVPTIVVDGLAEVMTRGGLLDKVGVNPGIYRYRENNVEVDADNGNKVTTVLSAFCVYARNHGIGDEVDDDSLGEEFLKRLINIGSLQLLRKKDNTIKPKATRQTLTLRSVPDTGSVNDLALKIDYVTSKYILDVAELDRTMFAQLEAVAFGNLVAEALLTFNEPPAGKHTLENVSIYLDAPLLLDILRVNQGREQYGDELRVALKSSNVSVRIFYHSLEEAERIIETRTSQDSITQLPMSHYKIESESTRRRLQALRGRVQAVVEDELGYMIEDRPQLSGRAFRGFSAEEEAALRAKMASWSNEDAKDVDVYSIGALVQLRSLSSPSTRIYDEKHIFLTRNDSLARIANNVWRNILRESGSTGTVWKRAVPLCLADKQFAGISWLMQGAKNDEVIKTRLIANCMSAIQPKKDVAIRTYNLLLDSDENDAKIFEAIITDQRAESILNDSVYGMVELVTPENVIELFIKVKAETAAEVREQERASAGARLEEQRATHDAQLAKVNEELNIQKDKGLSAEILLKDLKNNIAVLTEDRDKRILRDVSFCLRIGNLAESLFTFAVVVSVIIMSLSGQSTFIGWLWYPSFILLSAVLAWDMPDWALGSWRKQLGYKVAGLLANRKGVGPQLEFYIYDRQSKTVMRREISKRMPDEVQHSEQPGTPIRPPASRE